MALSLKNKSIPSIVREQVSQISFVQRELETRSQYLGLREFTTLLILKICSTLIAKKWNFVERRVDTVIGVFHGKRKLKFEAESHLSRFELLNIMSDIEFDQVFDDALRFLIHDGYIIEQSINSGFRGMYPTKTYKITPVGFMFFTEHPLGHALACGSEKVAEVRNLVL